MVLLPPIVVEIRHAQEFIQYVLETHAPPSTLIVSSSKADFLGTFQSANATDDGDVQDVREHEQPAADESAAAQVQQFAPTLRLLSTSRTLKLVFCSDITQLRAYLACLATDNSSDSRNEQTVDSPLRKQNAVPILAILNPIDIHRSTSSFSAQGLNRTIAVAVEAAYRTESKLVLAETTLGAWSEELSILNVTNRRLGELALGRTVTAKAVAKRWCSFE